MAIESEILTLGIDINDDPLNQKLDAVEQKITSFKEKTSPILEDAMNSNVPGYGEAMAVRYEALMSNLDNVYRTRKAIEHSSNSVEREDLSAKYRRQIEMAERTVADMFKSTGTMKDLTDGLGKKAMPTFVKGISEMMGDLGGAFKRFASELVVKIGNSLTDDELVKRFMGSEDYQKIIGRYSKDSSSVFSDANMSKYIHASLATTVPQHMRPQLVGGSAVKFRGTPKSFDEMLPESFRGMPVVPQQRRKISAANTENPTISQQEFQDLDRLVRNKRWAADAAVAAGVYSKLNGKLYYNPKTTYDNISAMGGFAMEGLVRAAVGESKYGTSDVHSEKAWKSISKKIGNNNELDNNLDVMRGLHDIFGTSGRFRPNYYEPTAFDQAEKLGVASGPIKHGTRTMSNPYAEYTLEMLRGGAYVNGKNPVVNVDGKWVTLPAITGPAGAKASGNSAGRAITIDDFHTVPMRTSMLSEMVRATHPERQIRHNEFSDDMIYVKYPKEFSNPYQRTDEEKQEFQKLEDEIAGYFVNGYSPMGKNGPRYIHTRSGKTHMEFMKEDVVDELGRFALGVEKRADESPEERARIRHEGLKVLSNGAGEGHFFSEKDYSKAEYNKNLLATEGESLESWWGTKFGFTPNAETEKLLREAGDIPEITRRKIMREHGTPNIRVVVGNFRGLMKDENGKVMLDENNQPLTVQTMDGQNWGDASFINESFQGRTYGGKATFSKVDLNALKKRYPQLIRENAITAQKISELDKNAADYEKQKQNIITEYGDFLIPKAAANGVDDLLLPYGTQVVESIDNIKNKDLITQHDAAGNAILDKNGKPVLMSQDEINERRSRDYSDKKIFAKTTYDAANSSSRWLSKQIVNSAMAFGFRDPVVSNYFNDVLLGEVAKLSDEQYLRDVVFGGDQTIDLNSNEARTQISNHIGGMFERYREGERLMPTGVYNYGMAAAFPTNVINDAIELAGGTLTPEQRASALSGSGVSPEVLTMQNLAGMLGIIRFPATAGGNISAVNRAANYRNIKDAIEENVSVEDLLKDKTVGPKMQRIVDDLHLDPKGFYLAAGSPILEAMQSEDFDGDLNGHFGIDLNNPNAKTFASIMGLAIQKQQEGYDALLKAADRTPEEQAKIKEALTQHPGKRPGGYSMFNPQDSAHFASMVSRDQALMGVASRGDDLMALIDEEGITPDLAKAILDFESMYDVVSVQLKSHDKWKLSKQQGDAIKRGKSFTKIAKKVHEAASETIGKEDGNRYQVFNQDSLDKLAEAKLDTYNLPSINELAQVGQVIGGMRAKQMGLSDDIRGEYGEKVFDYDTIFQKLALPENVESGSRSEHFIRGVRSLRAGIENHEFVGADKETLSELQKRAELAKAEIKLAVANSGLTGQAAQDEIDKQWKDIGGKAFDEYVKNGYHQANVEASEARSKGLKQLTTWGNVDESKVFGGIGRLSARTTATATPAVESQVEKPTEKPFIRPIGPESGTVSITDKVPSIEKKETEEQETARLLHEAINNKKQEKTLLENKEAISKALASGNLESLIKLSGIGETIAQKAINALQGGKLATAITTSSEEMKKPVATVTVPQMPELKEKKAGSASVPNGPRLVRCGVCGTKYPETLGECPNAANHDKYTNNKPFVPTAPVGSKHGTQETVQTPSNELPKNLSDTELLQRAQQIDRQLAIDRYNELVPGAQEFSKSLYGSLQTTKELLEGTPSSIARFDKTLGIASSYERRLKEFKESDGFNTLQESEKRDIERLLDSNGGLVAKASKDFSLKSVYSSQQLTETIAQAESKANGTYDAQLEALQKWDEKIKEVEADQKRLLAMSSDPKYSKDLQNQFKKSADKIGDDLTRINASRQNLGASIQDQNQKAFDKQIEGLEDRLHPGNKYQQQSKQYKQRISDIRENLTSKHDAGLISDSSFNKDMDRLKDLEKQTSTSALAMSNAFKTIGTSLTRSITSLASRFGRQLFQKALTEAKKFVQEFNKSMTSIQMITLKSDEQMSTLGDSLIAKAKELKISVAEITQSAETLYRQGLSDQEVSERLDVISKFSKVSGTKVDAATKLITIAMNTGLVSDPQIAADIVTALGDNAATNASEIEKGIEKAGAAAAADGTTFAQLASMLTAITSSTQIGGNVAGRTLNTIFGRMNKIGTDELIYDENGHAVSGSAVAQLLAAQGIKMYDENGNKRSSYDTLYALSQRWDKMSDAEQQQIANAIAGTRQYSNFAAIMQGMTEGKVDQYMTLTESSSGIVDNKYEIYTKSLEASLTNLKNTFDELVHDLTNSGALTGIVDFIAHMVTGVDNLTNSMGGLGAILTTVMPMLLGLTMLKTGMASGNLGLAAVGLGAAAIGGIIASTSGDQNVETAEEKYTRSVETQNRNYSNYVSDIDRAKQLKELGSDRTVAETVEFKTLLTKLAEVSGISFDDLTSTTEDAAAGVKSLATSAKGLGDAAKGAVPNVDDYADYIINGAEKDADNKKAIAFYENAAGLGTVVAKAATEADTDYYYGVGIQRLPIFTQNADGTYSVVANAHERITGNYSDVGSMKAFITSGGSSDMPNRKNSIGSVFGEALRAPDYKYNVPSQYVNRDDQDWINYFNNGPFGGPEDLPDEVLEAVAKYWSSPNRIKTRNKVVRDAAINKIAETLGGEEYAFIPEEYRTRLPELLVDSLPDTQWNTKDVTPTAIKYALLSAAGITDETDLSTLGTKEIVSNIRDYVGNNGSVTQSQGSQYALEEVGSSGYYIDLNKQPGEEGYYVSKEEAERRVKAYNKSLEPIVTTSTVSKQVGEIKVGDSTIATFDSSDITSMNEAGEAYRNALAKVQNIKDTIEAIKETPFFESMNREDKEAHVMNLIKTGLKQIGIDDFSGELAEFLLKDAKDIVYSTQEAVEEEITTSETNPLEKPNFQAVQDYALEGRTNSYNTWSQDEKTAYKLTADRVYRAMQESGATDIDTWLKYVNDNGIRDFETLYQNGEFGRLMQQVRRNPETGMYEGPADIMDQIMRYTLSNGSEGAGFVSNKQKADYAQSMYDTLLSGETAFISYEAAQEAEKADRAKYEAWVKQRVDEARAQYGDQLADAEYTKFENYIRSNNAYTGVIADTARIFTDDEKKYLQEIVGEELYDRLTGRSGVAATADEQAYASMLISNRRAGLTGLTSRQSYNWLTQNKSRLSTVGQEGGLSRTVADAYLSQWGGWPEYAALLEKKNITGLSEDEQKQLNDLTQSLDNFEQQSKIKIDVEGVQTLEEAGKVAEGTAAKLEKLRKGGSFKIQATLELENQAFSNSQIGAKLFNGTRAEQIEALTSLGYSESAIQNDFAGTLAAGRNNYNHIAQQQAGTFDEWYNTAKTFGEREYIERYANSLGYRLDDNGKFKLTSNQDVQRNDRFFNAERLFKASTLATAQSEILEGTLTANTEGREEEYAAAESKMGEQGTEYLRMLRSGKYSEPELTAQLIKARAEVANTILEAAQEDLVKELGLSSDRYTREHASDIAKNRDIYENGSAAEELALMSTFARSSRELQGAQYALTNYTSSESASTIASFLGMEEKDVRASLGSEQGRAELQSAINDQTKNVYSSIAQSLDKEGTWSFDSETGSMTDLKTALQKAADNATGSAKTLLQSLADSINDAGELVGQSTSTFAQEYDKIMAEFADAAQMRSGFDWLKDNIDRISQLDRTETTKEGVERTRSLAEMVTAETDNPQMARLLSEHREVAAALNLFDTNAINGDQFNAVMDYAQYGRQTPGLTEALTQGLFNSTELLDNGGMFNIPQTEEDANRLIERFNEIRSSGEGMSEMLDILLGQYPALKEFLETGDKDAAAGALEEVNAQMTSDKVNQAVKYSKASKNIADAMALIRKGGKDASEGFAMLRENSRDRVDQMTAAMVGARGANGSYKSGDKLSDQTRNVIASAFSNVDADDLKDYTSEQIEDLLEGLPEYLNQQLVDDLNAGLAAMPEIPVDLNGLKINADGTVDLSSLESALNAVDSQIFARLLAMIEAQGGEWGSVKFKIDEKKGLVVVSADTKFNKKGGYSRGGSGKSSGGGGGKSATDTLLENQKRRVSEIEHTSKMLDIREKYQDFTNDYAGQNNTIDEQISTQEELRQAYQDNIAEMNTQLGKVKQDSDDWKKLKDAIMQAEEALASVNNTINELNGKRINILEQQQEYESMPLEHELSMLQKYAQNYQLTENYDEYNKKTQEIIEATERQIEQKEAQLQQWYDLQARYKEGDDEWYKAQKKINEYLGNIQDLRNTKLQTQLDDASNKLSQSAKELSDALAPLTHTSNVLEMFSNEFQTMGAFSNYRDALQSMNATAEQSMQLTAASIEATKAQIASMSADNPELSKYYDKLYELEESYYRMQLDIRARNRALQESFITELVNRDTNGSAIYDHASKLYTEAEKAYKRNNDDEGLAKVRDEQAKNITAHLNQQKQALADYLALQNSGRITAGTEQWKTLELQIRSTRENISALANEYEEVVRAVQETKFEDIQESFKQTNDLDEHRVKMIQYEETRYKNDNQLTNYGTLLKLENELQNERAQHIEEYIEKLKQQQKETTNNEELNKKITTEIYRQEEALKSVHAAIDKNNDLYDKNVEDIRKARQAVENIIDKEIRTRIQKERDMLAATVTNENTILDVIRRNYTEQWNLEKKTLNLKKQTLNEEKNLINERLNAKKNALNEENKYEELAEYQRQLALISADRTRTKEANELRRKIKDLQEDLAFSVEEQEVSARNKELDDQMKAIDDYTAIREEDLNEFLENANNFKDALDNIMSGTFRESLDKYLAWMKENNKTYKTATEEARKQMEQSWTDTWERMYGELHQYWNEADSTMRSKEGFVQYMMNSDEYKTASESRQKSLVSYWNDVYDDYTNSLIDNADYSHIDESFELQKQTKDTLDAIANDVNAIRSWLIDRPSIQVEPTANNPAPVIPVISTPQTVQAGTAIVEPDFDSIFEEPVSEPPADSGPEPEPTVDEPPTQNTQAALAAPTITGYDFIPAGEVFHDTYIWYSDGTRRHYAKEPHVFSGNKCTKCGYVKSGSNNDKITTGGGGAGGGQYYLVNEADAGSYARTRKYASGGLVDYTGPAWVDGTKTHPESFLDATDTAILRSMLDSFNYIRTSPYMTNIGETNFGKPSVSVGDVNVNLYEAKLESDADYDEIAQKVGKAFTKQLQKDGMNLAAYTW